MQVLEKILEEIDGEKGDIEAYKTAEDKKLVRHWNNCIDMIKEIIRSHLEDGWILCEKELPETGANVILTFKDTFHTHESWPRITVMPAWICNVDEENPKGMWAIEGRLGNYCVDIENGVAWMPLPEPYQPKEEQNN